MEIREMWGGEGERGRAQTAVWSIGRAMASASVP